jgi:hypothetical protein
LLKFFNLVSPAPTRNTSAILSFKSCHPTHSTNNQPSSQANHYTIIMVQTRSAKRVEPPIIGTLENKRGRRATATIESILWKQISRPWAGLPLLVQEAVLKELAQDYNRYEVMDKRHRAAYATVNLQWQEFFEKLNFNKLVLADSDLERFGEIVRRRTPHNKSGKESCQPSSLSRMPRIRHIWLQIQLLPYTCSVSWAQGPISGLPVTIKQMKCKVPEYKKEMAE